MLFDLYQHLGMKVEFEVLALEFVMEFERSPPAWIETGERPDPALDTGGIAYFALGGTLTDASAPELEKLRNAAPPNRRCAWIAANWSASTARAAGYSAKRCFPSRRGKGSAATGEARSSRFWRRPASRKDRNRRCRVGAAARCVPDSRLQGQVREAAVNYAVTFEVLRLPGSLKPGAEARSSAVLQPVEAADQAMILSGELSGAGETLGQTVARLGRSEQDADHRHVASDAR